MDNSLPKTNAVVTVFDRDEVGKDEIVREEERRRIDSL